MEQLLRIVRVQAPAHFVVGDLRQGLAGQRIELGYDIGVRRGADQTVADVSQQLQTTDSASIPIVKTSVAQREGLDDFYRVIESASAEPGTFKKLPQHKKSNPLTI